jgi:SAM-dependent methyltransferase
MHFFTPLHTRTRREYLPRMNDDKVRCMQVAKRYDQDYWDGDRRYGYGGYGYDGRWKAVAERFVEVYGLKPDARILDVGCGKAHLLYELEQLLPEAELFGFDTSLYAIRDAPEAVRDRLMVHKAQNPYPFPDDTFDLVYSLNALHNLEIFDLKPAVQEIERVGRAKYVCVESYRDEQELFNLQCWALTCESFHSERAWKWLYKQFGYTGDYEFVRFE